MTPTTRRCLHLLPLRQLPASATHPSQPFHACFGAKAPVQNVICTQQAVKSKNGAGTGEHTAPGSQTIRPETWTALYRGLRPALVGTGVSQGVYFYLYSLLRKAAVGMQVSGGLRGAAAHDIGILGSLLVASAAGCGNVLLTNPFWVLVTRMQTQKAQQRHKGALTMTKQIYDEGGVLGFWKGVVPTLLMVANPTVQYVIYEWLRARLAESKIRGRAVTKRPTDSAAEIFVMSALAKLGATVMTYPMQLIKSRLQAAGADTVASIKYEGTADAVCRIYNDEGLGGFYHGMKFKIGQSVLTAALLFMVKEKLTIGVRKALAP